MGRLRTLSGDEVCAILSSEGFQQERQRGSHVTMQKTLMGTTVTVVVPMHRELATGTLRTIVRQSGLSRVLFETK